MKEIGERKDKKKYQLTRELRLRYIADDIVKGLSKKKIAEKYSELWDLSFHTVYSLYREALVTLTDEEGLEKMRDANTERLLSLYNKAIEEGDSKTALKALDLLNKTNSIYVTKVNLGTETEFKFNFE